MGGTHVRVRLVTPGMVASDILLEHPNARMACIEVGRRQTHLGLVVDHFALTEGLTAKDIEGLLAAWNASYGMPATSAGAPFALRLPLPLSRVTTPGIAELHQVDLAGASPTGHILQGGLCDLWIDCADPLAAEALARSLQERLPSHIGATVAVGDPSLADRECWAALRLAEDIGRVA